MSTDTSPAEAKLDAALAGIDADLDTTSAPAAPAVPKPTLRDRAKERAQGARDWAGRREGEAWEKVKGFGKDVATPDFTIKDFDTSDTSIEKKIAADLLAAQDEIKRNPERAQKVLDEMDADALLMKKILESRRGIRGILSRLDEKLSIKGVRLSAVLGTYVVAHTLDKYLLAAKLANPLAGGITGGVVGGIWGYIRGRNKQESATRWLTDVNVIDMTKINRTQEDFDDMEPAELDIALGVINNAVREGKVRGGTQELRQMMQTYRFMKEARAKKGREKTERDLEKDIIEKLDAEDDIGKALTAQASEKYKGLYEEIIKGKKKQVWASALKGAVAGATIGTVLSVVMAKLAGGGGTHGQESNLQGKEQLLRAEHAQHADIINQSQQGLPPAPGVSNVEQMTQFQQHADIIQHANNLLNTPGAHIDGFTQSGIEQFGQHLQNNLPLHDLIREAGLNNIDLSASVSVHGQTTLGNFLMTNKEAFLHLAPELQRQVLSFPSLAPEIIASATAAGNIATAEIASAVVGGVALGVIGFGLGAAGKKKVRGAYDKEWEKQKGEQKTRDEGLIKAEKEWKAKEDDENVEARKEISDKFEEREAKILENIEATKRDLIGSEAVFSGFVLAEGRSFKISGIGAEGQLEFIATDEDVEKIKAGEPVFPDISIEDIINDNGNLDLTKVEIIHRAVRIERRPAGRTEISEVEELIADFKKNSGKFIPVELIPVKKVGRDKTEFNLPGIKLTSGTILIVEPKSAAKIRAKGKDAGDTVNVRIVKFEPVERIPGRVFNVSLELEPEAIPAAAPITGPEPAAPAPGAPAMPVAELLKRLDDEFEERGPITATNVAEFRTAVDDFYNTNTDATKETSEKVVIKTPGNKYFQINIFSLAADKKPGKTYKGEAFYPAADTTSPKEIIEIPEATVSTGGYVWFLENEE